VDNPRIDELRRRVEKDPASIAFAQLAEEYRRAGDYDEAIRVSRTGLAQHPGYLSARVTLGRALLEIHQLEEAEIELEQVVRAAPDNLAAIRALADLHQLRDEGSATDGTASESATVVASSSDPSHDLDGTDDHLAHALGTLDAAPPSPLAPADAPPPVGAEPAMPPVSDPVLSELEGWLDAIVMDRDSRRGVTERPE
jgi:tetratricopeptide (TPR) repeat protein